MLSTFWKTKIVLSNNGIYSDKDGPLVISLISERAGESRQATQPCLCHWTLVKTLNITVIVWQYTPCIFSYMMADRNKPCLHNPLGEDAWKLAPVSLSWTRFYEPLPFDILPISCHSNTLQPEYNVLFPLSFVSSV